MAKTLAFFISPHGFGHAARACSVMQALHDRAGDTRFLIITTVPHWFFSDSLGFRFSYFPIQTDIGLVQLSPLREDLDETLKQLDALYPIAGERLEQVTRLLTDEGCDVVLSDISPLGILAAEKLDLPSVLIENFTWDWIYRAYQQRFPAFEKIADYLQEVYSLSTFHIQARPYCESGAADLVTNPISRPVRTNSRSIRSQLGIAQDAKVVIVTMGGIHEDYQHQERMQCFPEIIFLVPGSDSELGKQGNILHFPHRSQYYHPDLIAASDLVIGKVGYSTLAEAYRCGKPFGYIPRTGFRESDKLEEFILSQMAGMKIAEEEYINGNWTSRLNDLLNLPVLSRHEITGAEQVAMFIVDRW